MENNKLILSYCRNFNKIINSEFLEGDNLSIHLVDIYKNFIFKIDVNNLDDLNEVKQMDEIMGKYVEDYHFREMMQKEILTIKVKRSAKDVVRTIVEAIISIFRKIEMESTRKIDLSVWI